MKVGDSHTEHLVVDRDAVERFRDMSGDVNPIHVDRKVASELGFSRPVAHGAILLAALSRIIGTRLPGPGSVWIGQQTDWVNPVLVGDELKITVTVRTFSVATKLAELAVEVENVNGKIAMTGEAKVKVSDRVSMSISEPAPAEKVVLITGGSRGIGAETARRLAADGWTAAINFRYSAGVADGLVEEIEEAGGKAVALCADVSKPGAAVELVRAVADRCGGVDAVVHCATPPLEKVALAEAEYRHFRIYLDTYLGAVLELIQAASPAMAERKFGRFVLLGTSAILGPPTVGWSPYVTAKGALESLMRCAAVELGPTGITVNMVSPGMTVTELTDDIPLRLKEIEARRSPARRLATPEDTANAIAFLLQDRAGYLNGTHLPLTGGPL